MEKPDDDSAVAVLRHLEDERGKMFTEAEYQEMRNAVLDELAHGARIRPFTLFTFGVIGGGLLALFLVGVLAVAGNKVMDYMLAIVSAAALATAGYFFWSCLRGVKMDAMRSLDARLDELEQLRKIQLISTEEYQRINAHILIARQRSPQRHRG